MAQARSNSNSGRIEVSVPKNYSQIDDSVWEDVESYIYQGFLTSHAVIQNQFFVFKTVNHLEMRQIDFMRPYTQSDEDKKGFFRAAFIAHSIFIVNGNNSLVDREKNISKLVKLISKLNNTHQEKIFENLKALNERAARAFPLVEAYSFENRSRFKWMQHGATPINSVVNTGIAGTESLGMNWAQSMWTALNKIYDRKEQDEKDWQNAKFIGGCFAGKALRSLDDRDKMRFEREKKDKEELKIKVLKQYLNRSTKKYDSPVETVFLPDGRQAEVVGRFRADSAEELAKQLTAALNNEKDAHDLAVENHFKQINNRNLEIHKERQKLIEISSHKPINEDSGSNILSRSEAEERVKRLKALLIRPDINVTPDIQNSNSDTE